MIRKVNVQYVKLYQITKIQEHRLGVYEKQLLLVILYGMKMDKTAFKAGKMEDQINDYSFWSSKKVSERLAAANYLIAVAYHVDFLNLRLDRTKFSCGKAD